MRRRTARSRSSAACVAPADAKAGASHLGGGGLLHAHAGHRLSHALRPPAAHAQAGRLRAGVGRLGRPRRVRRAAGGGVGRQCHRHRLGQQSAITSCSWAPRASSTARTLPAGGRCRRSARQSTTLGEGGARSARRSGRSPASAMSTSCSSIPARRRSRSPAWWSSAAAWWCSAPAPPATTSRSMHATSGCGRSACRARISPISSRPARPTSSCSTAASIPA